MRPALGYEHSRMVAQTRRISPGSGLNVDTAMPCARPVRPAWSEPSPEAPLSQGRPRVQQLLDRTRRLADALLVLDERKAHVTVAAVAEPDPGTDGDVRVARETERELEGAELLEPLGDRRPDEHRPARRIDVPTGAGEPAAERVTPAPVDLVDLGGIFGRLAQRHGGRDLDRLERPVVEVGLQLCERADDVGPPEHEADAPAGHRERLGQAVELDRAI